MNYDYEIHTAAILQVVANNSSDSSMLKDHPPAILGSTFQHRATTNAKQTQTEQFAVPIEAIQENGSNIIRMTNFVLIGFTGFTIILNY
jgi:hypothetical protein